MGTTKDGNVKFCIKPCEASSKSCDTVRHAHSKVKVLSKQGYLKSSDQVALLHNALDCSSFSEEQVAVIQAQALTVSDWEQILQDFQKGSYPAWFIVDEALKYNPASLTTPGVPTATPRTIKPELVSPRLVDGPGGFFSQIPTLSFDSVESQSSADSDVASQTDKNLLLRTLKTYDSRFQKIKDAWGKPFLDIEANMLLLLKDIKVMQASIGSNQPVQGKSFDSVWNALGGLGQSVKRLESNQTTILDQVDSQITEMVDNFSTVAKASAGMLDVQERLDDMDLVLKAFDRRFSAIKPVFDKVKQQLSFGFGVKSTETRTLESGGVNVEKLLETVKRLEKRLEEQAWTTPDTDEDRLCRVETMLRDQESRLDQIANRVTGAGVKMGNCVFPSFEDLHEWVKIKVPKGRFGFFVDAHSFLEFFVQGAHHSAEASAAAESHSDKAGYATYLETQMAASFKNLFPSVFGKGGSATLDDAECLPAITSGDKWDNGTTGVKHQLSRNMNDISHQLDSVIKKVLRDHHEARQLAIDCVTASKRFVIDLLTFMSTEYVLWQQRGLTKKDSWLLVCRMVRRIFEDMQSVRISARNIRDKEDVDFTSAMMIYASLKCHDVMEGYTLRDFEHHPNISAVITRHLAANFVKPDASTDKGLDKKISGLSGKVDSLESRIKNLESRRGDKN